MTEDQLNARLDALGGRLAWISNTEARAAWVNGFGANGEFNEERTKIIDQAEQILDQLQAAGGSPQFKPAG
ncbi:hypothetical protein [Brevundimonas sp. DWR2-3-1b1]|uniref:hypothetical protein n=1 Tax=Brevundimonas sp. DWR2-3-1b1 TaxID=2804641 RepID=UPI003CFB8694